MSHVLSEAPRNSDRPAAEIILGYLNFSAGRSEPSVHLAFNTLFSEQKPASWSAIREVLTAELERLTANSSAFGDVSQARTVLEIVFDDLLPAYRKHHADLLFHLSENDLLSPFFMARLCEAALAAGAPWTERDRIVSDALNRLNDYVGHRPLAVLENGRKADVYPHERFRPVPLFIRGAGVAEGPYQRLVAAALDHLVATPRDLLEQTYFEPQRLDELALDVRAHDALHPAFKRTNYLFGEWDPHLIDNQGYYRRFVVRRVILDALSAWMSTATDLTPAARLHDASAVLCGTILMASAISGWGPAAHDSTSSLSSLLPVVARQRDAFYAQMMSRVRGEHAARLKSIEEATRQPFGHVRQQLNIYLANFAASQMQRRAIAELFARMGYVEAAREEAARIPAASIRFECELNACAESVLEFAGRDLLADAADQLEKASDLLVRGIECGALIDPWNILGFQGQFPLFVAREDAVPDPRAEWLINFMGRLLTVAGRALTAAAARGESDAANRIREWIEKTAGWWDRYATSTVSDLPVVRGAEIAASSLAVAATIGEWRAAGSGAGDLSFWRERVGRLESPEGFAEVVRVLLNRGDFVAASGLLIQWLSQSDSVGLGDGHNSFSELSLRWLRDLASVRSGVPSEEQVRLCRRFLDFVEANAGELWKVPKLTGANQSSDHPDARPSSVEDPEDEDDLFGAAYEGMIYRDTTSDGHEGEVLETPSAASGGEFDAYLHELEPRLRFLDGLARLWRLAAGRFAGDDSFVIAARHWRQHAKSLSDELTNLAKTVAQRPIEGRAGDLDANIEYDAQLQTKNHLLHLITATAVRMTSAERLLRSRYDAVDAANDVDSIVLGAILRGDAVTVRRKLPLLLKRLIDQQLLYVAVENGGDVERAIAARSNQDLLTLLATELPRMGMLVEARQVLRTALRMERRSRPNGLSVTEFDRLFRSTLEAVLQVVLNVDRTGGRQDRPLRRGVRPRPLPYGPASRSVYVRRIEPRRTSLWWGRSAGRGERPVVTLVAAVVDRFLESWLRHAATMRLTSVEALNDATVWSEVRRFINRFGGELFHARSLPLGNLRAILHEGIDVFLDHLIETDDPLEPSPLVAALQNDEKFRRRTIRLLGLIYSAVVDEIERFVEYNSTTTQSDYGERFDSFLDFLRAEAAYRRDEWELIPLRISHEVLAASGFDEAAREWERLVESRTSSTAQKHIARLAALEKRHAMRLPSITDRIAERFVKPFAVDRMVALIPAAVREARSERRDLSPFRALRREIDFYLMTSTGSAAELPEWLEKLDAAVTRVLEGPSAGVDERESVTDRPIPRLRRVQVLRQFGRLKSSPRSVDSQ